MPVIYLGAGSPAASAPVTGAGALVVSLAGVLSGLAMVQLKRRGAAACLGATPEPMDLRTARPAYGAPEMSLYSAALCDVIRSLGLPFMGTAGASDAKTLDLQAAIESTAQVILSGFSGATLVHDVGFLDAGDAGSLGMLVMTDEIIGMARRMLRGLEVTDDTLALDLIDRVGPGGEFMSAPETARRCRGTVDVVAVRARPLGQLARRRRADVGRPGAGPCGRADERSSTAAAARCAAEQMCCLNVGTAPETAYTRCTSRLDTGRSACT